MNTCADCPHVFVLWEDGRPHPVCRRTAELDVVPHRLIEPVTVVYTHIPEACPRDDVTATQPLPEQWTAVTVSPPRRAPRGHWRILANLEASASHYVRMTSWKICEPGAYNGAHGRDEWYVRCKDIIWGNE